MFRENPFGTKIRLVIQAVMVITIEIMISAQIYAQSGTDDYVVYLPLIVKPSTIHYYVDNINGNDTNSGRDPAEAWRTLDQVNQTNFLPNTIIHFRRGGTWTGELLITDSGAPDAPITVTDYGAGEKPVFRNPGGGDAIHVDADWVVVENLRVQEASVAGVRLDWWADHNIVRNIEITNVGIGVLVDGRYNLVTNNYIHDLNMVVNTNNGGTDDYGAVGIWLHTSYNEISYNTLVNCIAPSYDWGVDGGAFEMYGETNNNYIHHNWAANSDGFLEIGGGSAHNNVLAYNVSLNNGRLWHLHLEGQYFSNIDYLKVEHNTIVEIGTAEKRGAYIFSFTGTPSANTILLRNNIIYIANFWRVSEADGFLHTNNLYYLTGDYVTPDIYPLGSGEMLENPYFTDLNQQDFHLTAGSAAINAGRTAGHRPAPLTIAINAGLNLGYTYDFDNYSVPANQEPDLGAFEYQTNPAPTPTPGPSPTPTPPTIVVDDADINFTTAYQQDAWQTYTKIGGQHYGDTHHYNSQIGSGQDIATWQFTVPQPGRYKVYAWWWEGSWRPTDVPYTIHHLNGNATVRMNQQINGGQWNSLGTFSFQAGGSVTLSDDVTTPNSRDIVADAIRVVFDSPLP